VFDAPDLVDDQLWPQLRRSLDGIVRGLNDRGFDVLRARAMTDGSGPEADGDGAKRAALYAELEVAERPAVTRHEGPPVAVRKHAASFYESYADDVDPETYGPFIDGDRYVVEREREFTTVREYLESDAAGDVALGAQVEREFAERDVLVGDAVATLAPAFGGAAQGSSTSRTREARGRTPSYKSVAHRRKGGRRQGPRRESRRLGEATGRLPRQTVRDEVDERDDPEQHSADHRHERRNLRKDQPEGDIKREREREQADDHDPACRVLDGRDERALRKREVAEIDRYVGVVWTVGRSIAG